MNGPVCLAVILLCGAAAEAARAQDLIAPVFVLPGAPQAPPGATNVSIALRVPLADVEALEILRLGRSAADRPWQIAEVIRRGGADRAIGVQAPAGLETLLLIRVPGYDGYLLDGPFRWPHRPAAYTVPIRWRRTVRGHWRREGAAAPVWVGADLQTDATQAWPQCAWLSEQRWECVGVPLDMAGVVVSSKSAGITYALALSGRAPGGVEETVPATAVWGRLVVAAATGSPATALADVGVAVRRMEIPRARPQAVRVLTTADTAVRTDRLTRTAFWLAGTRISDDSWVELTAKGRAPARLPLREVAGSPAEFPHRADLDPALAIAGRVTAGPGMPASGTVVSLFRLVPDPLLPDKRPPKRLLVSEERAQADGGFRFENVGMEKFELLAVHPAWGRAEQWVEPDGQEIEVALTRPVQAVGRVLRGGEPAANVPVRAVPDLAQFAAADDIVDLVGGEAHTDAQGRFALALPAKAGGELRIGSDGDSVRRLPLPPIDPALRIVDFGDIELGDRPVVRFVLEGAGECGLMLAGPEGRAGLTVVRAARIGPVMFEAALSEAGRWRVVATCDGRERVVLPGTVDVRAGEVEPVFRLSWPR